MTRSIPTSEFTISNPALGMPPVWDAPSSIAAELDVACDYLTGQRAAIDAAVHLHGGVLLRGLACIQRPGDVERTILALSPVLRDYVGGTSPRSAVHGNVMTATHVPPSWSIPLHQEMTYTLKPPGRIYFYCEQPATGGGGASIVGDMREALAQIAPAVRGRLERFGLQLRRTLPAPDVVHRKPGVQKPWTEVFNTEDPRVPDAIARAKGWRTTWRSDGTLMLWQDLVPAIRQHPITGDAIWCNQAHFFAPACMLAWAISDGRIADRDAITTARKLEPEILDNIFLGNGDPVADDDALHVRDVLCALERPIDLRRHDLLVLDNLILAHGRAAFRGERRILVALADSPRS